MNDSEQYLIKEEPFYQVQSDEVELYTAAYNARLPVMVKGPTGCGKSRFISRSIKFYFITLNLVEGFFFD